MFVNEIFLSIEGEGEWQGYLTNFIRLQECNLNCSYCDTRYACGRYGGTEKNITEIINELNKNVSKVTITGGEPLIHKNITELVDELILRKFQVNIETNGSINISKYITRDCKITMDYKTSSSGEQKSMFLKNLEILRETDVLKFVVGGKEDLDDMLRVINTYKIKSKVYVSPVFNKVEIVDIINYMKYNDLTDCKLQLQIHKYIWNPKERGV